MMIITIIRRTFFSFNIKNTRDCSFNLLLSSRKKENNFRIFEAVKRTKFYFFLDSFLIRKTNLISHYGHEHS